MDMERWCFLRTEYSGSALYFRDEGQKRNGQADASRHSEGDLTVSLLETWSVSMSERKQATAGSLLYERSQLRRLISASSCPAGFTIYPRIRRLNGARSQGLSVIDQTTVIQDTPISSGSVLASGHLT